MVFRRRLIFWLAKEYIKKWSKTILFFFSAGLVVFFGLWILITQYKVSIPHIKKETIGVVGAYTPTTLPGYITNDLAKGLTKISSEGKILPNLATDWEIKDNGKTYIFHLKKGQYLTNKKPFNAYSVQYNFSDAAVQRPKRDTIIFILKDRYSPFLTTVSRPIFTNGYVGVGSYTLKKLKLNGTFVQSLELVPLKNADDIKSYQFYPTTDALKTAFMLGDITQARGLSDDNFRKVPFSKFSNVEVKQGVNTEQLVTLFYNTKDPYLSDRDVRVGLTYGLPDVFPYGKRAYTFYPQTSWAYSPQFSFTQDLEHAKQLTDSLRAASPSSVLILSIKTLAKYETTAEIIKREWEKIGIQSIIEIVDTVPNSFQIFLGEYTLPKDPDQYMLWHSRQEDNITNYENKRIDKLLEDGRKTVNVEERKKMYADVQKYLLADSPAAFLYFPYDYTITRK